LVVEFCPAAARRWAFLFHSGLYNSSDTKNYS
jgi:hypothetical protein